MRTPLLTLLALLTVGCPSEPLEEPPPFDPTHPRDDVLRVNQLQAEGTHNSYHQLPPSDAVQDWQYGMPPLDEQLAEHGVRQFELDAWWDERGFHEVFHAQIVDEETSCALLTECLATLRSWSDANPGHHPLFVWIEPKTSLPPGTNGEQIAAFHDALDTTWPDRRITPQQVLGEAPDLATAIAEPSSDQGWPLLGEVRGTAAFVLLGLGPVHFDYTNLPFDEQVLFTNGDPGEPWVALTKIDDPVSDEERIREAVADGVVIRTRADGGLVEPLAEDTSRLEAALRSGAHSISTDIPGPDERFDYVVSMPDGTPSRCNPVTAPSDCVSTDIEDPELLAP